MQRYAEMNLSGRDSVVGHTGVAKSAIEGEREKARGRERARRRKQREDGTHIETHTNAAVHSLGQAGRWCIAVISYQG